MLKIKHIYFTSLDNSLKFCELVTASQIILNLDGNDNFTVSLSYLLSVIQNKILKHSRNDNNYLKYNNTKMKRELRYIYREPQIILERAARGSRAAGLLPLLLYILWNYRPVTSITSGLPQTGRKQDNAIEWPTCPSDVFLSC